MAKKIDINAIQFFSKNTDALTILTVLQELGTEYVVSIDYLRKVLLTKNTKITKNVISNIIKSLVNEDYINAIFIGADSILVSKKKAKSGYTTNLQVFFVTEETSEKVEEKPIVAVTPTNPINNANNTSNVSTTSTTSVIK